MPGLPSAPGPSLDRRRHRWQAQSWTRVMGEPAPWAERDERPTPARSTPRSRAVDPIAVALAADARQNAGWEGWLGLLLVSAVAVMAWQGWLLPLLAAAFVAAPVVGLALGILDRKS
ncbi:hypothetical protein JMJ55_22585 [Belnapia sp. T6]|uniref:Uncharacterized protein n=1 Tax=Belnapia mucosa TaxID=2804532 RepID=A0ABS1V8Z6_9PROT|nr:hypothetical protein [Belnapia mucosa]MBL6458129.1 hypothetical protein [Belnapia mucosa]